MGTFAVQIAKVFGADVTGVCSTRNVDMVRSIGANHVIDYTKEDFTNSGQRYDLIFDTAGNRSLSECRRALTAKGTLVIVGGPNKGRWLGPVGGPLKAVVLSPFVRQRLLPFLAHASKADLTILRELLYLEAGHARGKVVITMEQGSETPHPAA